MLGISAVTSHLQLSVHLRADHLCGSALAAYPLGSVTDPFLEVCSDRAALVHHSEPLPWGPQGRGGVHLPGKALFTGPGCQVALPTLPCMEAWSWSVLHPPVHPCAQGSWRSSLGLLCARTSLTSPHTQDTSHPKLPLLGLSQAASTSH